MVLTWIMGNGPPILLTLIAGSCLLIIYRLYPPACQRSLRAPRPKENYKERETGFSSKLKAPRPMPASMLEIPPNLECRQYGMYFSQGE